MSEETTFTVTQSAVQRLLDAVQENGAIPRMQREWIISWAQSNLTAAEDGAPTQAGE